MHDFRTPRNIMLYNQSKAIKLFSFLSQKEQDAVLNGGQWAEHPNDFVNKELAEMVKGFPSLPTVDVIEKGFGCPECDFEGKNAQSLLMHRTKRHKR